MRQKPSKGFMWKRNTALFLSLILIVQLVCTMPIAVGAEDGLSIDWTDYYVDTAGKPIAGKLGIKIMQNGAEISEAAPLDPAKNINVQVNLDDIPVLGEGIKPYIKDGDYAIIPLAENFRLSESVTVPDAKDDDGRLVAKMSLINGEKDGKYPLQARIDFVGDAGNSVYNDEDAGVGSAKFSFDMQYGATGGETTDGLTYKIKILDKTYTISYPPTYTVDKSVVKTPAGKDIDVENQTITWQVVIDGTTQDSNYEAPLTGYTFEDNLTTVGDYVPNSFKVGNDLATAAAPTSDPVPGADKVLKYAFGESDKTPKTITFQTKIKGTDFYKNGALSVTNKAELKQGATVVKYDTVTATVGTADDKWIDKQVSQTVSSGGKINLNNPITWTVTVDPRGKTLKNAYILEEFPAELDPTKFVFELKDENGAPITLGSDPSTPPSVERTAEQTPTTGAKYKIHLGTLTGAQKRTLTITAKVAPGTIFTGVKTFTNKATLFFDQGPGIGIGTGNVNVGIGTSIITKEHKSRNDATGIVTWQVNVNRQDQTAVTNPVAYDLLVYGGSLDLTGAVVEGGDTADENSAVLAAIKNTSVTQSVYQKYVAGSAAVVEGTAGLTFKVYTVKKGDVAVADVLATTGFASDGTNSYTFRTQLMDITKILNTNQASYKNYVQLFDNTTYLSNASSEGKYINKWLVKSALTRAEALAFKDAAGQTADNANQTSTEKGDIFNYNDKSVVFRLLVDASKLDLAHLKDKLGITGTFTATLTDTLPNGWEFLPLNGESGPVYKIFDATGASATGSGAAASVATDTITPGTDSAGEMITFSFDAADAALDTKAYVIILRAGPNQATKEAFFSENHTGSDFTNVANLKLNWGEVETNYTATQKVTIKNTVLDKKQTAKDAKGILTWTIDYNPSNIQWPDTNGQKLTEVYLEDTLPNELQLLLDSNGKPLITQGSTIVLSLQKLKVNEAGTVTTDGDPEAVLADSVSYRFDETLGKFILKFHLDANDGQAYRFTYQTKIVGDESSSAVTNTVTLLGKTSGGGQSTGSYQIVNADSSAMVNYFGRVELTKQDGSDNNKLMSGVVFELRDSSGRLVKAGVTNAVGKLFIRGLDPGTYTLQEKTPAGYVEMQAYTVVVKENPDPLAIPRMTTTITKADGSAASADYRLTIVNYRIQAHTKLLTVKKSVTGARATDEDKTVKAYTIHMNLADGAAAPLTDPVLFLRKNTAGITAESGQVTPAADGSVTAILKNNESYTLYLPENTKFTVSEDTPSQEGFKVTYAPNNGSGTLTDDVTVTVSNHKSGGSGSTDPTPPTGPAPVDPTPPIDPAPVDPAPPTNPTPPTDPDPTPNHIPDPEIPKYVTPPNPERGPDAFILIDENGAPLGHYHKTPTPEGAYIYVDENGAPLGSWHIPKTGDEAPLVLWTLLMAASLTGAVILISPRKRR